MQIAINRIMHLCVMHLSGVNCIKAAIKVDLIHLHFQSLNALDFSILAHGFHKSGGISVCRLLCTLVNLLLFNLLEICS